MLWHELTSPQIDKIDRDLPVVIPLASCEQHGRHLPVFTDSMQIQEIVDGVEKRLSNSIVVAPVLWLGVSHHHLDFPGALSVPPKIYGEIIQSIADCFLRHRFRRLLFLNGHGGNFVPVSHALSDLIIRDDRADAATLALASWFSISSYLLQPDDLGMETPRLSHACEYETSLMLAIREDLVRLPEMASDHVEKIRPWTVDPRWSGKIEGFHRFHRWTSTGHMGKPEAASREKGEEILQRAIEAVVEFLGDFSRWPTMEVLKKNGGSGAGEASEASINRFL